MSNGIPDTHHAKAAFGPLKTIYGIEHNAPNASPKLPDIIAQTHTESCFLIIYVIRAKRGHTYKYIIHQSPKP